MVDWEGAQAVGAPNQRRVRRPGVDGEQWRDGVCLGYKTEADAGSISLKQVGGSTEILGALIYPLHDVRGDVPCWQVEGGGRFSASWVYNSKRYYVHVRHEGKDLTGNWGRGPALWSTEAGPK